MTATVNGKTVKDFLAEATEAERDAYFEALGAWLRERIEPLVNPSPRIPDDAD